jgi:peptidoglycan-associated lipoprotein
MRAFTPNRLLIVLLASSLLAACSSRPADDDVSDVDTRTAEETETAAVEPRDPVRPDRDAAPLTAEGYHNHQSHYDGTTDSRIIYFAFDRSEIPAASFDTLRAHARYLSGNPNARVRIEGHTDERGTREYNIGLGERRAKSIEQFLRVQGVPSGQIEVVSYGEERPAARGQNEMAWAQNRRAVIDYRAGRP